MKKRRKTELVNENVLQEDLNRDDDSEEGAQLQSDALEEAMGNKKEELR